MQKDRICICGIEKTASYSLAPGDTINLFSELGMASIESFTHSVGSELSTISYSGCYSNSCTINFTRGTPLQDREHRFTVIYTATDGKKYRASVTVYELEEQTHYDLGDIAAGSNKTGEYISNSSNMSCSATTSGLPVSITVDTSGTKQRIKVTNNNNTMSSYDGKEAILLVNNGDVRQSFNLDQCFSSYDPWKSSISITGELVREVNYQVSPQIY